MPRLPDDVSLDTPTALGAGVGDVLNGQFRLDGMLGRGGMGQVFRATDLALQREVAVKVLPATLAGSKRAARALRDEAARAIELTHPAIARVYHFAWADEQPFLVLELVEGPSLSQVLDDEDTFAPARALEVLKPLADALDYAHECAVIHRDVKPANILVRAGGAPVLIDFGIAAEVRDQTTRAGQSAMAQTLGTLSYMSPEQVRGKKPASSMDVYSLAATAYELLGGEPPFFRGDPMNVQYQILNEPPDALDGIPEALWSVLERGLAKDPGDRFASAGELVAGMRSALEGGAPHAAPATPVPDPIVFVAPDPDPIPGPAPTPVPTPAGAAIASGGVGPPARAPGGASGGSWQGWIVGSVMVLGLALGFLGALGPRSSGPAGRRSPSTTGAPATRSAVTKGGRPPLAPSKPGGSRAAAALPTRRSVVPPPAPVRAPPPPAPPPAPPPRVVAPPPPPPAPARPPPEPPRPVSKDPVRVIVSTSPEVVTVVASRVEGFGFEYFSSYGVEGERGEDMKPGTYEFSVSPGKFSNIREAPPKVVEVRGPGPVRVHFDVEVDPTVRPVQIATIPLAGTVWYLPAGGGAEVEVGEAMTPLERYFPPGCHEFLVKPRVSSLAKRWDPTEYFPLRQKVRVRDQGENSFTFRLTEVDPARGGDSSKPVIGPDGC